MKTKSKRKMPEGYVSTARIAETVGVPQSAVNYLQRHDEFPRPTHAIGGRFYFTAAEAEELIGKLKAYEAWRASNPLPPGVSGNTNGPRPSK